MIRLIFFIGLLGCLGCSKQTTEFLTISGEKDLIPEGIAMSNNTLYISSILKNKIIQYDLKTQVTRDFITSNQYGFSSGVGLFAKDSLLFALTNSTIKRNQSSRPYLYVFNVLKQKLVKTYTLNDNKNHFWNDLTIDNTNQVFITDTRQHMVYNIRYPNDDIEIFYSDTTTTTPNGIDISSDGSKLFIASTQFGIRILDVKTKLILNEITKSTNGIDGLKFYNGNLFAVRNIDENHSLHTFLKISLSKKGDTIETVEQWPIGKNLWNVPTTFVINDGAIYLLANSQMDNLDQNSLKIINSDSLTDTYIIKSKIKNNR